MTGLETIKKVCEIIQNQMELEDGQVYLYNQKINIPPDDKLYVAVGVGPSKPFGSTRKMASGAGVTQRQSINVLQSLQIDILSRTTEALDRKEEILLALKSAYAMEKQLRYGFMAAPIGQFTPLGSIEGAAIPYRFSINVNVQYSVSKDQETEYYDTFATPEVVTER